MKLELLKSLTLPDFLSGSSIAFYEGKLFLIGDDANHILVLNEHYQKVGIIQLFNFPGNRILKPEKADLESSTLITLAGQVYLLVLGSTSLKQRTIGFLIPLQDTENFAEFKFEGFVSRLKTHGIDEVNIEGATLIGDHMILSNRGNSAHPTNKIIVTEMEFWHRQAEVSIEVAELNLSQSGSEVLGVSGLCYESSNDILLLTLSSELTSNAYDDGLIGDSYIGWINNASTKIKTTRIALEGMIKLSEVDMELKGEKVEGLCVEQVKDNELIFHLVSDDDQGESKLFKVRMSGY